MPRLNDAPLKRGRSGASLRRSVSCWAFADLASGLRTATELPLTEQGEGVLLDTIAGTSEPILRGGVSRGLDVAVFSPDGRWLACARDGEDVISLFRLGDTVRGGRGAPLSATQRRLGGEGGLQACRRLDVKLAECVPDGICVSRPRLRLLGWAVWPAKSSSKPHSMVGSASSSSASFSERSV